MEECVMKVSIVILVLFSTRVLGVCDVAALKPHAQLEDCDFSGQTLSKVDVTGAKLKNVRFVGAKLEDACFDSAELEDVTFDGAVLSGATFNHALLTNVSFTGSPTENKMNMEDAQFNNIAIARQVDFVRANLKKAQFKGSRFVDSAFVFVDLTGVDMSSSGEGAQKVDTFLTENNIFFKIVTTDTNVEGTHLPLDFFLSAGATYYGTPAWYFG
jgi:uncharacterized protein YjbI with pentapeptide repeats